MTVNQKVTGTVSSMPEGIFAGVLTALGVMMTGVFIITLMVHREILQWNNIGYGIMCILIFSSWAGSYLSAEKTKRRRIQVCLCTGAIYFALLMLMAGLFFGGKYSGVGESCLLIFCGSILGSLTGLQQKYGRTKRKVRNYHS